MVLLGKSYKRKGIEYSVKKFFALLVHPPPQARHHFEELVPDLIREGDRRKGMFHKAKETSYTAYPSMKRGGI
jgi:hypothetical protein